MGGRKQKRIHSDIVRDSINTFGTNAIRAVLGFISAFIVLRRVNPQIKGYYNQMQDWGGGFYTILGLSVASAVIYFVARHTIRNSRAAIQKLCVFISAAIVLIGGIVLAALGKSSFFKSTPAQFLFATVLYGFFSFLLNICTSVLRGENKFKSYNIVNLAQQVLVTVLAVFIAVHPSAFVWIWGTNAISAAMILFAFYGIKRWNGPKPQPAKENDFTVGTGSMVKYSLKSHVSNVLTFLNTNLGKFIVQGTYAMKDYGVYGTANTMMQQVWILPDAVSQVIMSRIAAMKEQKDKLSLTLLSSKIVTYITTLAAFLLIWAANLFVPRLFPMYTGTLDPLKYLIVGSVFISYAKVLGNSIAAYGRPELNIIPTVLGIAANILCSFALIPRMGINGVALASSISLTVQGLSCIAIFCRFSHAPVYRLFLPNGEEMASLKRIFTK
jgi:O-antigen/teichoic acid export membrane protein